jgi:hypothetical protein
MIIKRREAISSLYCYLYIFLSSTILCIRTRPNFATNTMSESNGVTKSMNSSVWFETGVSNKTKPDLGLAADLHSAKSAEEHVILTY